MPQSLTERRSRSAAEAHVGLRSAGSDKPPTFYGQAAVLDSRAAIGDPFSWGFYEQIAPGAFDRTLREDDTRFLVDHATAMIVARKSAGDLRMSIDPDSGAYVADADLDQEVSYVRDLTRNVDKRRITGMSFQFITRADEWTKIDVPVATPDGKQTIIQADLRTLIDIQVPEVSAVTFPAYDDTTAALRAIRSNPEMLESRAEMLRESSLNRRMIGRALDLMTELRAGKVLSAANMDLLQNVLDQLAAADSAFDPLVAVVTQVDEALDAAQADISGLLGVANPDANDPDEGDDDGQRSAAGPVPPADYMRALALRHGLTSR
ncbi:MAG: HK97 family phage prohead protease [Mycobacteriaceae bacterium]